MASKTIDFYSGICDASSAVPFGDGHFLALDNRSERLRLYRSGRLNPVAVSDPLGPSLGLHGTDQADLEAAARIGNLIFITGSHSDHKGKIAPNRHLLFAAHVSRVEDRLAVTIVGQPYRLLRADIEAHPVVRAAGDDFNIEGLAASPDGALLVGLRDPKLEQDRPDGSGKAEMALVVAILNPQDLLQGRRAALRTVDVLDLHGGGIRSLEYDPAGKRYLVLAGRTDDDTYRVFDWSGPGSSSVTPVSTPDWLSVAKDLTPEALFLDGDGVYALSDDGDVELGGDGTACKDIDDPARRRFRGFRVRLAR